MRSNIELIYATIIVISIALGLYLSITSERRVQEQIEMATSTL